MWVVPVNTDWNARSDYKTKYVLHEAHPSIPKIKEIRSVFIPQTGPRELF